MRMVCAGYARGMRGGWSRGMVDGDGDGDGDGGWRMEDGGWRMEDGLANEANLGITPGDFE